MTCFPASQLDGTDFCTQSCGEADVARRRSRSLRAGTARASPPAIRPTTSTPSGPCGAQRSRLPAHRRHRRRGRLPDDAAVLARTATAPTRCARPARRRSSTSSTRRTRDLHSDHLYCLQRDCVEGGSNCGPGSRACPSWSTAAAHPPDICVPNCDSQYRCPPNHFCFRKLSGTGSPPHLPARACSASCASPTSTAWSASASATRSRTRRCA